MDSIVPSSSPRQTSHDTKEPTRWIAVALMPEGNVLGVLYDPNDHTFMLSWVDDDPEWPNPMWIAVENAALVTKLLADAENALADMGGG